VNTTHSVGRPAASRVSSESLEDIENENEYEYEYDH